MSDLLRVEHLSKSFGANVVLRDIDFVVNPGDVTSIIGASGSGKSTLLRCINLLETPTSGAIYFHDKNMVGRGVNAARYRAKALPAAGALLKEEDTEEKQITLEF